MAIKKKVKRTCFQCDKVIDKSSQKYVLIGTYQGNDVIEEELFHFSCWQEYFLSCIENKIMGALDRLIENQNQSQNGKRAKRRNRKSK